jgi:hypothetical protein
MVIFVCGSRECDSSNAADDLRVTAAAGAPTISPRVPTHLGAPTPGSRSGVAAPTGLLMGNTVDQSTSGACRSPCVSSGRTPKLGAFGQGVI